MMLAMVAGGAIGAMLRYSVSLVNEASIFGISGPLATLVVIRAGYALMGCLAGSFAAGTVLPEALQGFLAVGVLDAVTTFAISALDAGQSWQTKGVIMAGSHVLVLGVLSLSAFGAMFLTVRHSGIWQ